MSTNKDVVMDGILFDCSFKDACNNYNEVQGRTLTYSTYCPRTPFIFLSECKKSYTKQMERQNNMIVEKDPVVETNCVSFLVYR